MIPMVALIIYTVIVTNQLSSPEKSHLILVCFGLIAAGGVGLYLGIKAYGMFKHRNALSVGYECELAVGQDFTQKTALETTQEKILTSLRERPTLISIILPVLKLGVVIQSKIKKK
jgi:hypothetical protein